MEDKNVITAIGFAFREFAGAVLNRLGFDPGENFMLPAPQSGREEDFTYYWSDADYREFLEELREYTQP